MGLYGYKTEELAAEIRRRAFAAQLSRDHSDGPRNTRYEEDYHGLFVKIPSAGISAATNDGATPSITTCDLYEGTGSGGALVQVFKSDGTTKVTISVRHYGAAIASVDDHDFKYLQVKRMIGGYVVDVEYCN